MLHQMYREEKLYRI